MLALGATLARGWTPPSPPKVPWTVAVATPTKALMFVIMTPSLYRWTLSPLIKLGRSLAERGWPWLRDVAAPSKDLKGYQFDVKSRPPFAAFMPFLWMCQRELLQPV